MLQNSQFFTMHQRSLCWKPLTNRGAEQLFTICYRNWDIDWFLPISTSESIWSCFQSLSLISLWNKHLVTEAKMRLSQFMLKIPSVFSWFYKSRQRKKKKVEFKCPRKGGSQSSAGTESPLSQLKNIPLSKLMVASWCSFPLPLLGSHGVLTLIF